MRLTLEEAKARYGEITGGKWADETKWCVLWKTPDALVGSWINNLTGKPVVHIYLNRDMADALSQAIETVEAAGLSSELKTFDGCLMVRDTRGMPGSPSTHSYALALDINALENPLGAEPVLSPAFVKCFTDAGFVWGGDFKRKDGMHFSFAWE